MPSDEENVKFLYLMLTHDGNPTVDWPKVTEELGLSKGATMKRWSRLKQAFAKGETGGPTAHQLLWLCMKHSSRDKTFDWNTIAEKSDTTAGAAAKRYSRMKAAFDSGTATMPVVPAKESKAKKATGGNGKASGGGTKRKRDVKSESNDDGEVVSSVEKEDSSKPKRKRPAKKDTAKEEVKAMENALEDGSQVEAETKSKFTPINKTAVKGDQGKMKGGKVKVEAEASADGDEDAELPSDELLNELEAAVVEAQAEINGDDVEEDQFFDAEDGKEVESAEKVDKWLHDTEDTTVVETADEI